MQGPAWPSVTALEGWDWVTGGREVQKGGETDRQTDRQTHTHKLYKQKSTHTHTHTHTHT